MTTMESYKYLTIAEVSRKLMLSLKDMIKYSLELSKEHNEESLANKFKTIDELPTFEKMQEYMRSR